MIYVANAGPAVADIGPGDLRSRIDGQRERIEGTAAPGDGDVGRGERVANRLRARAGRWACARRRAGAGARGSTRAGRRADALGQGAGLTDAKADKGEENNQDLNPERAIRPLRPGGLSGLRCLAEVEECDHGHNLSSVLCYRTEIEERARAVQEWKVTRLLL
jgi:hypothetical protein